MSVGSEGLIAFQADRCHATLLGVEQVWLDTMIEHALENMPVPCKLIATTDDGIYMTALGARIDPISGAIRDYAVWNVSPVNYGDLKRRLSEPNVVLTGGQYDIPTLTEAVALLSAIARKTV